MILCQTFEPLLFPWKFHSISCFLHALQLPWQSCLLLLDWLFFLSVYVLAKVNAWYFIFKYDREFENISAASFYISSSLDILLSHGATTHVRRFLEQNKNVSRERNKENKTSKKFTSLSSFSVSDPFLILELTWPLLVNHCFATEQNLCFLCARQK